jgi:hypothetical protein
MLIHKIKFKKKAQIIYLFQKASLLLYRHKQHAHAQNIQQRERDIVISLNF